MSNKRSFAETPCNWQPCEFYPHVKLDDVIFDIATESYFSNTPLITKQSPLVLSSSITKLKSATAGVGAEIQFELNNELDFYALVIDELTLSYSEKEVPLIFTWTIFNYERFYQDLKGSDGLPAQQPRARGANGLPGGTGGKGGHRHSPTILLFIKSIKFESTSLEKVSFDFSLKGIKGGRGGQGGRGSNGVKGSNGRNGKNELFGCKRGKNGYRGGQPGRGGRGGDGGCGGNGPKLRIFVDDTNLWNILQRSKFDVTGADAELASSPEDVPGFAGPPGTAGNHGEGGDGGRRAGNCRGGNKGKNGQPEAGTDAWKAWNLGFGLPGTAGVDGNYDFEEVNELTRIAFNDPD